MTARQRNAANDTKMKMNTGLPVSKFRALDLFCGAGGVSMGLSRAGFDVCGVDIAPQPRYPFSFAQADALGASLDGFDFVWASPPCQRSSRMTQCRPGLAESYQQLIPPMRDKLTKWGGLYVIENVVGAPLVNPIMLCGAMFGLETYRHRLFESNARLIAPPHPEHKTPTSKAGHWKPGAFISVAGHCAPMAKAKAAMGIDWMNREELCEAIPPVFALFIGAQIAAALSKCQADSAGAPSCLIAYGKENGLALENSGIEGKLLWMR